MKNVLLTFLAAALPVIWSSKIDHPAPSPAPEFPSHDVNRWINSAPLKMTHEGENGLRGKVVLLNVWTFL